MLNPRKKVAWIVLLVVLSAAKLHAQINGCDDSPEAPSLVLAAVGCLGMFYGSSLLLKRIRSRSIG